MKVFYPKGEWYPEVESCCRGDAEELDDGTYTTQSSLEIIARIIQETTMDGIDWSELVSRVTQPTLLIRTRENYDDKAPILPTELALETVSLLQAGRYKEVSGNHITMFFGECAKEVAAAINEFLAEDGK